MKNNKFIYLTLFSLLFVFLVNSLPSVVLADVINDGGGGLTIMVCKGGDCTSKTVDCTIEYDDDCKAVCDGEFESCADTCEETAWSCEKAISDCQDNCDFTGDAQENCLRECGDYGSCEAAYRVCFGECSSASATCVMNNCVSVDCPEDECSQSTDCPPECTYIVCENGQNETKTGTVPCPDDDPCPDDEEEKNYCSVTATADPNPIPEGQNQTTISATSLRHTSLSKCKVDTYSLPHTFTQTDSSHTYTVSCTGNAGYNDCSSEITVTTGGFSVQLTANGQTGTIDVEPETDVQLTAIPANGITPYQSYDWYIEDKSVSGGCHLTNPSDGSKHKGCQKMSYLPFFDHFSFFGKLVLAAVGNTNTIQYQWSQAGTYKIYVVVKDSSSKRATSNTVTITVTPPPSPTCQILSFTINGKDNSTQNPLIVWVNALLKGYFSVNDSCKICTVSSDDTWGSPPQSYPISTLKSSYTESFKINTAGTYSYTLECVGADPKDIVTDTLSLQTVKAVNLPWWREIIPNLLPFLRGMIR